VTTEWPARRSKGRLLCGRRGPDGVHDCQGEVGNVGIGPVGPIVGGFFRRGPMAWPKTGYVESEDHPGWWKPSRTAGEKLARGERPAFKKRGPGGQATRLAAYPWRTRCPRCGDVAVVTSDVLG
jgi:hypothetical protein